MIETTRIDKWLWGARFFKTRSLATTAVDLGRVLQNEQRVKPAHSVKVGDMLEIHLDEQVWQIKVMGIQEKRGSATVAQSLYQETTASQKKRADLVQQKKYYREPAASLQGRPTKRDRRLLDLTKA